MVFRFFLSDLSLVLLLLIPGYFTFRTYLWANRSSKKYGEVEILGYSFLCALGSFVTLLLVGTLGIVEFVWQNVFLDYTQHPAIGVSKTVLLEIDRLFDLPSPYSTVAGEYEIINIITASLSFLIVGPLLGGLLGTLKFVFVDSIQDGKRGSRIRITEENDRKTEGILRYRNRSFGPDNVKIEDPKVVQESDGTEVERELKQQTFQANVKSIGTIGRGRPVDRYGKFLRAVKFKKESLWNWIRELITDLWDEFTTLLGNVLDWIYQWLNYLRSWWTSDGSDAVHRRGQTETGSGDED